MKVAYSYYYFDIKMLKMRFRNHEHIGTGCQSYDSGKHLYLQPCLLSFVTVEVHLQSHAQKGRFILS